MQAEAKAPAFLLPQKILDAVLRSCTTDRDSLMHVIAWFQLGKDLDANAAYLKSLYRFGGSGLVIDSAKFALWYDERGMRIARGTTAIEGIAQFLTWEQVAQRIGELLQAGQFAPQEKLDAAPGFARKMAAEQLWYLNQNGEGNILLPWEIAVGFPDGTKKLAELFNDPDHLTKTILDLQQFIARYEKNRSLLRYHYLKPATVMSQLQDLQQDRIVYTANGVQPEELTRYIADDVLDAVICNYGRQNERNFQIQSFFTSGHTNAEKAECLKRDAGSSGSSSPFGGFADNSAKGFRYWHTGVGDVQLSWSQVTARINHLIAAGRYLATEDARIAYAEWVEARSEHVASPTATVAANDELVEEVSDGVSDESALQRVDPTSETPDRIDAFLDASGQLAAASEVESYQRFTVTTILDQYAIWDNTLDKQVNADDGSPATFPDVRQAEDFLSQLRTNDATKEATEWLYVENSKVEPLVPTQQPGLESWSESATADNSPEISGEPADDPAAYFNNLPEPPTYRAENYRITDDHLGEGGAKTRYGRNIEAIRLVKRLTEEARQATVEEQAVLVQYVGWGGLPQAFDAENADWKREYQELSELLTPEEYAMARGSTLNAHYTNPTVIRAIFEAVANMGFETGHILEPACGVGNFFGMLPDSMTGSRLSGVELDTITGLIARKLYPSANIYIQGFEETQYRDGSMDLVIGNVPFGSYKVNDKRYDKLNFLIHDYFIAKSLDVARAGGVIAVITSKGTMDKQSPEVRRYIAQRAELLGAIRLPNTAFKASAGTEVTSDILFLQVRERPVVTDPDWLRLGTTGDGVPVNQYYIDHPEMVLGTMAWDDSMYGNRNDTACIPIPGANLAEQLQEAIQHIAGTYTPAQEKPAKSEIETQLQADPRVRNYSFTIVDGQAYFRENDVMTHKPFSPTELERAKGMVALRDHVRELMDMQLQDAADEDIIAAQRQLDRMYDAFTAKHGLIDSRASAAIFDQDDGYYLLCSLEILDDERKLLRKSDMFTKRTIRRRHAVTSVGTASEALAVSIGEKGLVDIPFMCQLCGKERDALTAELRGVIYRDITPFWNAAADKYFEPGATKAARDGYILINRSKLTDALNRQPTEHWVTADAYLSGDVRHKLAVAEKLHAVTGLHPENVEALKAVQPKDLQPDEIDVRLGATWVPTEYIHRFMGELLKVPSYLHYKMKVHYMAHSGEWHIDGKTINFNNIQANEVYGTSRASAFHIIEDSLNLRDVRVYDYYEDADGKKKQVLNQNETLLAQQKQAQIKEAFRDWIWKDADRRDKLVRLYNDRFNCIRPREYDGRHIQFAGMNPEIALKPHQINAIARCLYGGNTLLAHVVGAGKSFEMIAAGMEARRLGLINKNLYAVPNHLTGQFAAEYLRLYPNANILVATERDFEKGNRKRFCARVATGDYDAIIMGHSQYERIPVSQQREKEMIQQQIDDIVDGIEEIRRNQGERYTIKQLERARKTLTTRLKALSDSPRDDVVTFEQLGVDRQFIDEADGFKNLFLYTKMRNVAGISQTEAKKSSDLYLKCRYLDNLTGSRGTVFATGTPVSNSMTELYTMQRYLQYDELERRGLQHFDAWASTFGETVTAIELAPEGTGYRAKTRFARFYNLPELMNFFKEAADIQTADMLNLPIPKLRTGKVMNVALQPSAYQKEMVAGLAERADLVRKRMVEPNEDNMLKITNDGRLLALDQRLMNSALPDDPDSKVNACVENVHRIYLDGAQKKLTQLVFSDLSTPKEGGGFNVYQHIKDKLIARGVPASEIAFIHDAKNQKQRDELFAKVRRGAVRVLIGSTAKMGAGTNVQQRLVALHHLDVPWRPRDLQQRDGRILRQGNTNEEVAVYRYVTEGTFDAYSYQLVEQKQRFISQIMTSKSPVRHMEDIDDVALSYAEVKALAAGSPLIKERMDLDVEIARLKLLKSAHYSQQYRMEDRLRHTFPKEILALQERIRGYEDDIARRDAETPAGYAQDRDLFAMEVMGRKYAKREDAGQALLTSFQLVSPDAKDALRVGHYRGFELWLSFDAFSHDFLLDLKGSMSHRAVLGMDVQGNISRMEHAAERLESYLQRSREELAALEQQMRSAQEELGKPFPQEQELMDKLARLAELDGLLRMDEKTQPEMMAVDVEADLEQEIKPPVEKSELAR